MTAVARATGTSCGYLGFGTCYNLVAAEWIHYLRRDWVNQAENRSNVTKRSDAANVSVTNGEVQAF